MSNLGQGASASGFITLNYFKLFQWEQKQEKERHELINGPFNIISNSDNYLKLNITIKAYPCWFFCGLDLFFLHDVTLHFDMFLTVEDVIRWAECVEALWEAHTEQNVVVLRSAPRTFSLVVTYINRVLNRALKTNLWCSIRSQFPLNREKCRSWPCIPLTCLFYLSSRFQSFPRMPSDDCQRGSESFSSFSWSFPDEI